MVFMDYGTQSTHKISNILSLWAILCNNKKNLGKKLPPIGFEILADGL